MTVQVNGILKTGLTRIVTTNKTTVLVLSSMANLYDKTNARMSIHLREYSEGKVEVIINRSCDECKSFRFIGGNQEICDNCSYAKGWLEDGCY